MNYSDTMTLKILKIATDVARNPFAWPGGYPKFLVTDDGGCLCSDCVKREIRRIKCATGGDGFFPMAANINWEDPALYCDHCNERIQSAYAEDDATA